MRPALFFQNHQITHLMSGNSKMTSFPGDALLLSLLGHDGSGLLRVWFSLKSRLSSVEWPSRLDSGFLRAAVFEREGVYIVPDTIVLPLRSHAPGQISTKLVETSGTCFRLPLGTKKRTGLLPMSWVYVFLPYKIGGFVRYAAYSRTPHIRPMV